MLVVGVAEMVISNDVTSDLITYSLGSCLGIAIYDPVRKVGGLLHAMLPHSKIDPGKATTSPFMFVDTGVPMLFQAVYNLGGERCRLILTVAGGAEFLDPNGVFNIGERNCKALDELLTRNGWAPQTQDVGGTCSRTMRLELSTGRVSIKSPGIEPYFL